MPDKAGVSAANSNDIEFDVAFSNQDGDGPRTLSQRSSFRSVYLYKTADINDFTCTINLYDSSDSLLYSISAAYTNAAFDQDGLLELFAPINGYIPSKLGAVRATVFLTDYEGDLKTYTPSPASHSSILLDGTEVADDAVVTLSAGSTHDLVFYPATSVTGSFSFDDYAGLIDDEGYVYSFTWQFYPDGNDDVANCYYTLDTDPGTRHYPTKSSNSESYYFLYQIPLGHSITVHNLPLNSTMSRFHPPMDVSDRYDTLGVFEAHTALTYNGADISSSADYAQYGVSSNLFYRYDPGANDTSSDYTFISSGNLSRFNIGNGFNMHVYMNRRPALLAFTKVYDANDTTVDPSLMHTFRITLTDTLTGSPYAGRTVQYKIFDSDSATLDYDNDQLFAATDSNGVMEISVPAGSYVILGRTTPNDYGRDIGVDYYEFHSNNSNDYLPSSTTEQMFFPEIGMLPDKIGYSIEEISDDYTASTTGDTTGIYDGIYYAGDYSRLGQRFPQSDDTVSNALSFLEYDNLIWNYRDQQAEPASYQNFPNLTVPVFTNSRDTGDLTVSKVVTGDATQTSFRFTVTLIDGAAGFPTSIPYTTSEGASGNAAFAANGTRQINGVDVPCYEYSFELVAGESITFTGIPAGTNYTVSEAVAQDADYAATLVNESGTIVSNSAIEATVTNEFPTPTPTDTSTPTSTATPTPTNTSGTTVSTGESPNCIASSIGIIFIVFGLAGIEGSRRIRRTHI